ncbi:Hypothetical protein I595_342 [Croceitalea dokdonensis DOKDO 023]|uniref:Uncharacterized protein n=1 Tax=Croceitalea dokdonensis DOKDO 023 TaxID=1300341 RepID=A0A0P7B445_9FLAO|nr:hypothetical protein [Croceitalea dokdonensis]KPM33439.1 Hypothetical protein I595_342 [Croceitalea dokdonensis DOKDO 023]
MVSTAISGLAQELEYYNGPLSINDYSGEAEFGYQVIQSDTVLQGAFRFQKSNIDSLLQKKDNTFTITGSFQDGYPTGKWQFQFGEYQSANTSRVVDYQYRVSVNGKQEEANGSLFRGRPDGNWSYEVNQIDGSLVANTAFKSTISFERGVPQKSFKIENDSISLVGRFLRDGLAHDEWSLYSNTSLGATENWVFNEGVLSYINFASATENKRVAVFDQQALDKTTVINLNKQFLQLVWASVDQRSTEALQTGNISSLLGENIAYYKKIDGILSSLGKARFQPEFKVRVPHFPLDSLEIAHLERIKEDFTVSQAICTELLNSTQLNILKLSDQEAGSAFRLVERLHEKYVRPVERLLGYEKQGIIAFLAREKAITNSWPEGIPEIAGLPPDTMPDTTPSNEFAALAQLSKLVRLALEDTNERLSKQLLREQQQQELGVLEQALLEKQNTIKQAIDSMSTELAPEYVQALEQVGHFTDGQLKNYADITALPERLTRAKELKVCFGQLQNITMEIGNLPEIWATIQQKYTDRVWNPFTATLMDEEIKKRITTSYKKILEPYFLNQLGEQFGCEKAQSWLSDLGEIQNTILALSDQNTKKLERKLKKATLAQEVMAVLQTQNTAGNGN